MGLKTLPDKSGTSQSPAQCHRPVIFRRMRTPPSGSPSIVTSGSPWAFCTRRLNMTLTFASMSFSPGFLAGGGQPGIWPGRSSAGCQAEEEHAPATRDVRLAGVGAKLALQSASSGRIVGLGGVVVAAPRMWGVLTVS